MTRIRSSWLLAMVWMLPTASHAEHVEVRLTWPGAQASAVGPAVLGAAVGPGTPVYRRDPVADGELVAAGLDAAGHERYRVVVADPSYVRGEAFDPATGVFVGRSDVRVEVDELRMDLPVDASVGRLVLYRPHFEDGGYSLETLADLALPEPATRPESLASPFDVETILYNGSPDNRVDLVFLGDGYTADELDKYHRDVEQVLNGFLGVEPYVTYGSYFNAHRIDVVSNESGSDHPSRMLFKDTALDSRYDCDGLSYRICVSASKAQAVASDHLPANSRDIVLVVVNDAEYGGSGGSVPVVSTDPSAVFIALHETGHSFGLLADEYADQVDTCITSEPREPNSTRNRDRATIKWAHWIDPATPVPTSPSFGSAPGLYDGSRYCPAGAGMFRPTADSMMRTLRVPFFAVNEEALVKRIYDFAHPIDYFYPWAPVVDIPQGGSQEFVIQPQYPLGDTIRIDWYLNDNYAASGISFTVTDNDLNPHHNVLQAYVYDTTGKVRSDPNGALVQVQQWELGFGFASGEPRD